MGEIKILKKWIAGLEPRTPNTSNIKEEGAGNFTLNTENIYNGDPSDQALFFMPTAFMPPKDSVAFRDFELLFLTLGVSPTSTTSIIY